MGTNVIHLADWAVPSYRRHRGAATQGSTPPDSAWSAMARRRVAQRRAAEQAAGQRTLALVPAAETAGAPATGNYNLTTWLNGSSQDLIQAIVPTGGTVPEPATALLGALGLAGIAAVRRRKA